MPVLRTQAFGQASLKRSNIECFRFCYTLIRLLRKYEMDACVLCHSSGSDARLLGDMLIVSHRRVLRPSLPARALARA